MTSQLLNGIILTTINLPLVRCPPIFLCLAIHQYSQRYILIHPPEETYLRYELISQWLDDFTAIILISFQIYTI